MRTARTVRSMRRLAGRLHARGTVGLVPTMGYLHEGHLSLVRRAGRRCDSVVVSLFVNPIQFGPREDLGHYPRDFTRDRRLLAAEGVDVLFAPSVKEMYPDRFATRVEVSGLTEGLCGRSRPGHFGGVATVVSKLLNIVQPDVAVFGQKDAQQALMIRRMARDLDLDVIIDIGPTIREPDGLAMSSRNSYLTPRQRQESVVLYRSLLFGRRLVRAGERSAARLRRKVRQTIERGSSGRIDYVEVVDTARLRPVRQLSGKVLVAVAVWFGRTRLIDNIILSA